MKNTILSLMIVISGILWGVDLQIEGNIATVSGDFNIEECVTRDFENAEYSEIHLEGCKRGGKPEEAAIEHFTKLLALPDEGNWEVSRISFEYEEIELEHPLISNSEDTEFRVISKAGWYPQNIVSIGEPVIMRQHRFSQISIAGMQYNSETSKIRVIKDLDLELRIKSDNTNIKTRTSISGRSFDSVSQIVSGITKSRNSDKGSYLFISPDIDYVLEVLEYLKEWKQKLGHNVNIVTLTETGETNESIRDYLQNVYNTWEDVPEYVVLVGDVSGNIIVPSWYIEGYLTAYDVTDHPYTLLEGDDYFPDILIGRMSVQSLSQLQTIVSKIISYESDPLMSSDWFKRAIMCSFVMDLGGYYQMYSQRETVLAVREKLLDFTYTEVDTFISPWQSGPSNLANMINTGYSFINYRGAGSPAYWSAGYDNMFSIWDFDLLQNGMMLPMITSIVCGGGDFADDDYATSFGEKWVSAGSPQSPSGAIAFIGPSELDTKTPFNNCNDMGIYQGITQEGIFGTSEMMLRGKMELYNNYPDCHDMDGFNDAWDSDMFYFYVYNLLGDPGLKVWTDVPQEIEIEIPEEISEASCQIIMENGSDREFTAALTADGILYETCISDPGNDIVINVPAELDTFEITISSYGCIPLSQLVTRNSEIEELHLAEYAFSSSPQYGEDVTLTLEIDNPAGSDIEEALIEIFTEDEKVEIVNGSIITDIVSGSSVEVEFDLEFYEEWREEEASSIEIRFNDGELGSYHLAYDILSPQVEYVGFEVNNEFNTIYTGEENEVSFELYNAGGVEGTDFTAIITSLDEKCSVPDAYAEYESIAPDQTGTGNSFFTIIPDNQVLTGEPLLFDLTIIESGRPVWQMEFEITAGYVTEQSPTFSSYGYYALESMDSGNFEEPAYDWIEINPNEGGSGVLLPAVHQTSDGFSTCIDMPFQFCYYGIFYNKVTISSNGWISMGDEEYVFFRNRVIPSGVGPSAMIAPFWDEMTDGDIYTWYNSYDNYFVIEWYEFNDVTHSNQQTFEVILYDPQYYPTTSGEGKIKFQYQEIYNTNQAENYATIGIENHLQTEGLLLSYANRYPATMHEIASGSAIMISQKAGSPVPQLAVDTAEITVTLPPDTVCSYEFNLENLSSDGSLDYEVFVSHFPVRDAEGTRNLIADTINPVNSTYYTGYEMDMYAFLVHDTPDNEAVTGVQIQFPEYVYVSGATDIAQMHYNGETGDGALVSWGFGNGNNYNNATPQTFHVYFTVAEGTNNPIPLEWLIVGDGVGANPHQADGYITLMPSTEKYIWVEYPNGGEEFAFGAQDLITWSSYGDIEAVDIYYTDNYFVNYTVVVEDTENDGEYEWTLPSVLTDRGKVRVRESNGNEYDDSDECFSIKGLVITYPNSESVLAYGQEAEILWDFSGGTSTVEIDYTTNNGMMWHSLTNDAPNTGSYQFVVDMEPSDGCKIRLITYGEEMIISEMEGTFSVVDVPVDWLVVETMSGTLEADEISSVPFEIDTTGLTEGRYSAYISITTEYGQKMAIPVLLEVGFVDIDETEIAGSVFLENNYPNPFYADGKRGNGTQISFGIDQRSSVKLSVYNIKGQLVRVFIDEELAKGNYDISWDGTDRSGKVSAAGVYFYQLQVNGNIAANKKCLLLK